MAFKDEVESEIKRIFRERWTTTKGKTVPEPKDIGLGNDAVELEMGTVLYADLSGSTNMVDTESRQFAAEVYKAYLYAAAKIIREEGGTITAYDGDRIMAVFLGDSKNSSSATCALKINYAVKNIINPAIKEVYTSKTFQVRHVVGIDTSALFVARTGVRGDNDLVWVGRAANYAAKLTTLPADYPTYITVDVFNMLNDSAKYGGNPKQLMWEKVLWTTMNNMTIYRSNWWWAI